jgi:hypothetical protein
VQAALAHVLEQLLQLGAGDQNMSLLLQVAVATLQSFEHAYLLAVVPVAGPQALDCAARLSKDMTQGMDSQLCGKLVCAL